MTYIAKTKIGNTTYPIGSALYGTCSTAADTANKTVTLSDFDTLITGVTLHVKFTNSNIAANPKLIVGTEGQAKSIYRYGTTVPGTTAATSWPAGAVVSFTYTGDAWIMNDWNNTDTKVTQTATTTNATYELLFSNTANNNTLTEGARKTSTLTYNPSTKALVTGGTVNGYTLAAASAKGVDTSIAANSTSINLPTSQAVSNFANTTLADYARLDGANFTGPVNFGDSVSADDLTAGQLVVTGNASFTNNINANTINGVEVGSSPKFTDTITTVSVSGSGNAVTAASASNGAVTLTKGTTFKTAQTAITKPTAATNQWVSAIGQNANGVIEVDYGTLDTSGTWSGNATTATTADKLTGFSSRSTSMTWGNQTGSVITCFASSNGGGWGFRDNNPASGQMSMTIDGTIYIKEGVVNIGDAIKSITRSGTTFTYTTL